MNAPNSSPNATLPALAITTKIGLPCKIIGRGTRPGDVLIERLADGARRIYHINELHAQGGAEAIKAELDRVCAADKAL